THFHYLDSLLTGNLTSKPIEQLSKSVNEDLHAGPMSENDEQITRVKRFNFLEESSKGQNYPPEMPARSETQNVLNTEFKLEGFSKPFTVNLSTLNESSQTDVRDKLNRINSEMARLDEPVSEEVKIFHKTDIKLNTVRKQIIEIESSITAKDP